MKKVITTGRVTVARRRGSIITRQKTLLTFVPGQMPALLMDIHLIGLEIVEFLAYGGFVLWRQSSPWLVGPTVVLVAGCDLYVVVKFDYLERNTNIKTLWSYLATYKFYNTIISIPSFDLK